jgi:hypothetical protein
MKVAEFVRKTQAAREVQQGCCDHRCNHNGDLSKIHPRKMSEIPLGWQKNVGFLRKSSSPPGAALHLGPIAIAIA